ncbi:LOW QUALITY PROTEIN: armadillo repeat-containing protein 8 [Dioscorea cayenensis subsp. rotundata]|uniref:LOW QUALITY PROTEIN: armadillo repeat-containing protein 8 n=1 Tax=Dioscorea cayennensis subsp. rotundata TaxID=55577 RepID=A0AB40AY55_DIOCR|nr:LOW QUALITY PROTEIN: armadillo repeat-containing protein 8 [Dioscorea cayenensis subsp. rotundata]
MPSTAAGSRPEDLTARLDRAAAGEGEETLLTVLREVKNQIIGNKTKKLVYLHLGAVPRIVAALASARDPAVIVQAAAAIGSFACGVEDGVRAVIDAGAVPCLIAVLSHANDKVVDAGARSLRMIFQSKLAPKYDFLKEKNMKFLISLLNSENDNVIELAASIVAHSCEINAEQKALCDAGALQRLANLLEGSSNQKDACLDSIAAIIRKNSEVGMHFASIGTGKALNSIVKLIKDRNPRTRLLACVCAISIGHASPYYVQDLQTRTKMMLILVELLEESGRVGDDAPFALSELILDDEELHKQAISVNVVEKICDCLHKYLIEPRRLHGILLVFAELCSRLEECRCLLMSQQVLDTLVNALKHDCPDVRAAACTCIRSLSRSVKNLSAGHLSSERFVVPLAHLLHDTSTSVQVAALGAICNVAVDFAAKKSVFIQSGCVKQLVQLSKSMDSRLRLKAISALRNLMFLADAFAKESIIQELTISTIASLICDSETDIQHQALALVTNLVDGNVDAAEHIFADDGLIINAVVRQLHSASSAEICIQGMLLLSNIAAGVESHKEAVMSYLVSSQDDKSLPFITRFLQNKDSLLRTAAVWCIINLTYQDGPDLSTRIARLRCAGIVSQIKTMINDPCLDTKYRVRTALEQCMTFEDNMP